MRVDSRSMCPFELFFCKARASTLDVTIHQHFSFKYSSDDHRNWHVALHVLAFGWPCSKHKGLLCGPLRHGGLHYVFQPVVDGPPKWRVWIFAKVLLKPWRKMACTWKLGGLNSGFAKASLQEYCSLGVEVSELADKGEQGQNTMQKHQVWMCSIVQPHRKITVAHLSEVLFHTRLMYR